MIKAEAQLYSYQNGLTEGSLDPDKKAKKIDKLNQIIANAKGTIDQLTPEVTKAVYTEIEKYTQSAEFLAIQRIGGRFGGQGLAILVNEALDGVNLKSFSQGLSEQTSAAEVAEGKVTSFAGSIKVLANAFDSLIKRALRPLADTYLKPILFGFASLANAASNLPSDILRIATAIAAGIPSLGLFAYFLGGIAKIVSGGLKIAIVSALTPIIDLVEGIAVAVFNPLGTLAALVQLGLAVTGVGTAKPSGGR